MLNASSQNIPSARRLAASAIAHRSSSFIVNAAANASAYPSTDFAKNPTGNSSSSSSPATSPPFSASGRTAGTTMSIAGPALSCAMGTAPAAMYSTTQIPKCSSSMPCSPADAPPRSVRNFE